MAAWRLVLPVLTLLPLGCTVMNNLDGYASGSRPTDSTIDDTGAAEVATDTNSPPPDTRDEDTSPVADSGPTDSGIGDTTIADSPGDSTGTDTKPDAVTTDVAIDAADTSVADSASDLGVEVGSDSGSPEVGDTGTGTCHVVINEVETRSVTSGLDEFVELYNPCDTDIAIAGWKLAYRSAGGTSESNLVATFAAGAKVPAKGFFLAANSGGAFAASADATFSQGVADDGSVGLRDGAGALVDSVGWGSAALTNPFVEKAVAPGPASGGSISRVPNGTDTNDNSLDFKKLTAATPKS